MIRSSRRHTDFEELTSMVTLETQRCLFKQTIVWVSTLQRIWTIMYKDCAESQDNCYSITPPLSFLKQDSMKSLCKESVWNWKTCILATFMQKRSSLRSAGLPVAPPYSKNRNYFLGISNIQGLHILGFLISQSSKKFQGCLPKWLDCRNLDAFIRTVSSPAPKKEEHFQSDWDFAGKAKVCKMVNLHV